MERCIQKGLESAASAREIGADIVQEAFVFLSESETSDLLSMAEVVRICETVLAEMGRGTAALSTPQAMFLAGDRTLPTLFKAKGGFIPSLDACGFRVVGDIGKDAAAGESHFCYLLDPRTAAPRALVAHTAIHRMRTAACGLIAARALSASDAHTFALIGAGKIGRYFAKAFAAMFAGKALLIASRRPETAARLAADAAPGSTLFRAVKSCEEALSEAQTVVTLTSSETPVLAAEQFRPGMTIIGMGEHQELPSQIFYQADRFFVDDIGFASTLGSLAGWIKTGEVSREAAISRVDATLAVVVAGLSTGRRSDSERVLSIVQGLSIVDLALCEICRRRTLGIPSFGY